MGGDPHGYWILATSVAALLLGPVLHRVATIQPLTMITLDNFVAVVVLGLVGLEIMPSALAMAGLPALAALLLAVVGPGVLDRSLHRTVRQTQHATLLLAAAGMVLHSFTDGMALASARASTTHSHSLEVAVIVHQMPVATALWWLLAPTGTKRAALALVALGAATVAGFCLSENSFATIDPRWLGLLQAVFAGFLLHVLAHRSKVGSVVSTTTFSRAAAAVGGLAGLLLLGFLAQSTSHDHDGESFVETLQHLVLLTAPVVLFASAVVVVAASVRVTPPQRETVAVQMTEALATCITIGLVVTAWMWPWLTAISLGDVAPSLQVVALVIAGALLPRPATPGLPLVAVLLPLGLVPGAALGLLAAAVLPKKSALGWVVAVAIATAIGLAITAAVPTTDAFIAVPGVQAVAAWLLAAALLASFLHQTPQNLLRRVWST